MIGDGATMQGGQQPVYEPPVRRSPYLAQALMGQAMPPSPLGSAGMGLLAQALMQQNPKTRTQGLLGGGLLGLASPKSLAGGALGGLFK